jgi:CBS domain-containing protein
MSTKARDIMSGDVEAIAEDTTVVDAARKMKELDVGALPICGSDDRLKGVITDRDIVVDVLAAGRDPQGTKVSELANGDSQTVTIGADDSIEEALETMKRHQVRRLPVIDGQQLVGIISQADVARHVGDAATGDTVEAISE